MNFQRLKPWVNNQEAYMAYQEYLEYLEQEALSQIRREPDQERMRKLQGTLHTIEQMRNIREVVNHADS